jgi:lipopolysaccharide transport system ATP-binding protein
LAADSSLYSSCCHADGERPSHSVAPGFASVPVLLAAPNPTHSGKWAQGSCERSAQILAQSSGLKPGFFKSGSVVGKTMSNIAIKVENLSKLYEIGVRQNRQDTLRDHLMHGVKSLFSRNGRDSTHTIWALKDVSFEIRHGEVVGFIGKNGAGKSTLFKILSRITEPTKGRTEIYGRVGSLLEVGTGFHPELTGRENIYLNGAILGMKKWEIEKKFDEIVAFSEIEKFIDTPVKRYSSGMYVRLAFAVAAHLEPEILIVDEVLAVGDANFQKKCLGKMGDVAKEGRTVLFVSHNAAAIERLCERALWLEAGQVKKDAPSREVLEDYLYQMQDNEMRKDISSRDAKFVITNVTITGQNGKEKKDFLTGENLRIQLDYQCAKEFSGAFLYISIANRASSLFAANMCLDGCRMIDNRERGKLSVTFKDLPLAPQQRYYIKIGGRASDNRTPLFGSADTEIGIIDVVGSTADINLNGESSELLIGSSTSILVPYEWDLGNGYLHKIDSFKNVKLSDHKTFECGE